MHSHPMSRLAGDDATLLAFAKMFFDR
jgi:hypothetical protein